MEVRLPRDRLYALAGLAPVQDFVRRADFLFYQALVRVLIPDVLRPIPSQCLCLCVCPSLYLSGTLTLDLPGYG